VYDHHKGVYRLSPSILNDPSEDDDAAQETFINAVKDLEGYRGEAALTTWLYAIAVNVCRQQLRKLQHQKNLKDRLRSLVFFCPS